MKTIYVPLLVLIISVLFGFTLEKKPSLKAARKALDLQCSYVPSGETKLEDQIISVQAFYMGKTEVSNAEYREFLNDLKRKGEMDKYQLALYDSTLWNVGKTGTNTYQNVYHSHPAYDNYPVVNISKKGAELYCEWLSMKYAQLSGGQLKLKFRIPTHAEWVRAAKGSELNAVYAWGNPYLRNAAGQMLANFTRLGAENIAWDEETQTFVIRKNTIAMDPKDQVLDVTAPVKSYFPSEFGFYNLNGNVAEMISDGEVVVGGDWSSPGYDVRNESVKSTKMQSPTVGFRVAATFLNSSI